MIWLDPSFSLKNFCFIHSAHHLFLLECCTLQNETKGNTNKKNSWSSKTPLPHPPYRHVPFIFFFTRKCQMSRKYNFSFTDLSVYFLVWSQFSFIIFFVAPHGHLISKIQIYKQKSGDVFVFDCGEGWKATGWYLAPGAFLNGGQSHCSWYLFSSQDSLWLEFSYKIKNCGY